jgi:hypothetical protein
MQVLIDCGNVGAEGTYKGFVYDDDDSTKRVDVDNEMELFYNWYNNCHFIEFSWVMIRIDLDTLEITYGDGA